MWLVFLLLALICGVNNKPIMGSVAIIGLLICYLVQQGVVA